MPQPENDSEQFDQDRSLTEAIRNAPWWYHLVIIAGILLGVVVLLFFPSGAR